MSSKWISHARRWNVRASVRNWPISASERAGEVVALEVLEAELELPLALLPDGVEVPEELGHVASRCAAARKPSSHSEVVGTSDS